MNELIKYPKIYRICPEKEAPLTKKCLFESEISALLDEEVVVEEKIDGGICGLSWKGDSHQAQGRGRAVHYTENSKQFYGFNKWIYENYEKIQQIPAGWIVYGEWMRACHNIFYDSLPDYFIAFDVWNGSKLLAYDEKTQFLHKVGFEQVPLLYCGTARVEGIFSLVTKSKYSTIELAEGIVIKNYAKALMGKYVRREFMESMDEHWLKKPLRENKLK
jgi:ATP-dependent RNA circularization protein (DNA/RNA ligase family)